MGLNKIFQLAVTYSAIDKLSGPVKNMAQSVTALEKNLQRASSVVNFGQRIGISGAVVSEAASKAKNTMASFIEPFAEVQDSMAFLGTATTSTMGSIQNSLAATKTASLDWSRVHADSAKQFIDTTYRMASSGMNDLQSIAGSRTALTVAKGTRGDSGEAAEVIARLYNNLADKTKDVNQEMTRLGDVMVRTQQMFAFKNLGQLAEGLQYATPSAKQFGMSIEELHVVLGQMNNAGLVGSMAGTAYAATMRQMNKASQELGFSIAKNADGGISLIGTIENIKAKYGDFTNMSPEVQMAFQKAFGDEGLRGVSLLLDKTGDMKKAFGELTNSAGAAADAQRAMEDTVHARAIIAAQKLEAVKVALGEKLLGNKRIVDETIPKFTSLVEKVGNMVIAFTEAHPVLADNIFMMAALGTGLLLLIAPILSVASGFFVLAGHGMQGIMKLVQGVTWLRGILTSEAMLARLIALRAGLVTAFEAGQMAVVRCAAAMQTFILSLWQATRAAAVAAAQGLRSMTLGLIAMARQAVITAVTALPALISSVWAFTAAMLANPVTWVILALVALGGAVFLCIKHWDDLKAVAISVWESISVAAASGLTYIQTAINDGLNWIQSMGATFFQSGAALWEAFTGGIRSALSAPVEAVQEGLQWVRNLLPFSDAKEGPLSALTRSGRALVSTLAEGVQGQMPELAQTVAAGFGSLPFSMAMPELAAPGIPGVTLPDITGSVMYKNLHVPPEVPDLRGRVGYEAEAPKIPSFASFLQERSEVQSEAGQSGIIIHGPIHLHVEKIEKPDDLWAALKQFAQEVGG